MSTLCFVRTEVNVMTAPHAPEPINVPPRSEGKLRCDCQVHDCKDDAATGKRKKAHCVVRDGWCATKTRVNPLSAIFGRNLPPQTIRYCTTDYSECSAGFQGDSNVLCCSNRRFCNEGLSPSLSAGDLHRIPTDPRDNPKVSPITTQPPREDPTEGEFGQVKVSVVTHQHWSFLWQWCDGISYQGLKGVQSCFCNSYSLLGVNFMCLSVGW